MKALGKNDLKYNLSEKDIVLNSNQIGDNEELRKHSPNNKQLQKEYRNFLDKQVISSLI